ncbi:hypothetical protein ABH19_00780 [Leptospirillum sp. Group II 'CF-1']|nr:hypothetical protein ABH19_00780 [Leptospirillum sp. Group II 'CF-1']
MPTTVPLPDPPPEPEPPPDPPPEPDEEGGIDVDPFREVRDPPEDKDVGVLARFTRSAWFWAEMLPSCVIRLTKLISVLDGLRDVTVVAVFSV